jgi:hypothetical protein
MLDNGKVAHNMEGISWGPDVMNPYDQFNYLRPDATPGTSF